MPSWADDVIWWHVYPLGFVGAPIREREESGVVHRIERIEGWLDHLIEIGLNGLLLGPVFASSTHGYDTLDFFSIDPRLGDLADFDRLVAAAHARGIRVVLDGVFNHVGRENPLRTSRPALFAEGAVFEGHGDLVELDHASPETVELVVEVLCHWLARGVDGWRLDAAYAVPTEFWAQVLPRVRERFGEAWFLGEVIHGDYAEIVRASTMDSVTQYELWQAIWHGLVDRNFFELAHALGRHDALLDTFVPYTFVGNHDVTRIRSAVGDEFAAHALAVLFGVAGTPSVYAGDELGFTGVKEERWGGDDAVRPEFPADPDDVTPDAVGRAIHDAHRSLVAFRRRHRGLVRARTEVLELANETVALHSTAGDDEAVVLLSLAATPQDFTTGAGMRVAAGSAEPVDGGWRLAPRGWVVLER